MAAAVVTGAAAQEAAPGAAEASANTTAAAAAVATGQADAYVPDFLEHLVDALLALFDVRGSGNTWQHYGIAALIFVLSFLLRKIGATFVFSFFKKLASRTKTTLDDKLFPALEDPVKALIALLGAYAAVKVLKLSPQTDVVLGYSATVAFSCAVFWLFLRAFNTILDHVHDLVRERQMGVTAFMPWIKKTLVVMFVVFGALMIAQSLGANVRAFLAGLGIGGLAFALAAQDTIANLFGSVVVAIDQPFKIGEAVRIGGNAGIVEDIGLRSTKLRTPAKSLIVIPNKTVAAEAIINESRFTQRRVEQVIGLTYDATPAQLEAIVRDFTTLILAEPEVDPTSVMVYFRDFSASSLDIWIVYMTKGPDFQAHMRLRQRLNLAIMKAMEARGLGFAFPSQTVYDGDLAKRPAAGSGATKPVT
ncbi:MAG TPA: mechanosensitive ion channel family protein [Opitutaceae bacterium]